MKKCLFCRKTEKAFFKVKRFLPFALYCCKNLQIGIYYIATGRTT